MKTQSELENENTILQKKIVDKDLRIQQLENLLIQSRHKQFGASSEKTSPDQRQLFDEAEEHSELDDVIEDGETQVSSHKRKKKKRPSIPDRLSS